MIRNDSGSLFFVYQKVMKKICVSKGLQKDNYFSITSWKEQEEMSDHLPRTGHPQINILIDKFENEKSNKFTQVHRMIDLIEVVIKTYSAAIMGTYFHLKKSSDNIKGLLVSSITRPSLGHWQKYSRAIVEDFLLKAKLISEEYHQLEATLQQNQKPFLENIYKKAPDGYQLKYEYIYNEDFLLKGSGKKIYDHMVKNQPTFVEPLIDKGFYRHFDAFDKKVDQQNIIKLRNKYAHGAVPPEEKCKEDIDKYKKVLALILSDDFLQKTSLVVFQVEDGTFSTVDELENFKQSQRNLPKLPEDIIPGHPYLIDGYGNYIDLFPIVFYNSTDEIPFGKHSLLFLNDLNDFEKKKIVTKLHYPSAEHVKDVQVYHDFTRVLDIARWKEEGKRFLHKFSGLVEELTTDFVGRKNELEEMKQFINNHTQGFYVITGAPGIGKSALAAQFTTYAKKEKQLHMIDYYIKRGQGYDNPTSFLNHFTIYLSKKFGVQYKMGATLEDKYESFQKLLYESSLKLQSSNEKLVLIIDGLDEAGEELLRYIPRQTFIQIYFIYSTRKNEEIELLTHSLQEPREDMELGGLTEDDIRMLVWSAVSKYKVDNEKYIHEIYEKSKGNDAKGNALYVKLLVNGLKSGEIKLNEIHSLPNGIKGFYDKILYRLSKQANSLKALYTFAVTKDYLTIKQLSTILQVSEEQILQTVSNLQEVLIENNQGYQLYHESLRDYLLDETNKYVIPETQYEVKEQLLLYCRNWNTYMEKYKYSPIKNMMNYPFHYYAQHLFEMGRKEELLGLIKDEHFLQSQIMHTKHYHYSFSMYENFLKMASKEESLFVAEKVLELHDRIYHETRELFGQLEINEEQIADFLTKVENKETSEQMIFYVLLMFKVIHSNHPDKTELLKKIAIHVDGNLTIDTSVVHFNQSIPSSLMLQLLIQLSHYNVPITPIIQRNIVDDSMRFLESIHWEKKEEVRICLSMLKQYPEVLQRTNHMLHMVDHLIEHHQVETAKEILAETEKILDDNLTLDGSIEDLQRVARGYFYANDKEQTKRLLDKVKTLMAEEKILDGFNHLFRNDDELAFAKFLKAYLPISDNKRFYSKYTKLLLKNNELDEAYEIVTALKPSGMNSYDYRRIIDTFIEEKKFDRALFLIEQMEDNMKVDMFIQLIRGMKNNDLPYTTALNKAVAYAQSIKHKDDRYFALVDICHLLLEFDEEDEALKIANKIKEKWYKELVTARQIYHSILKQDSSRVFELSNSMEYVAGFNAECKESASAHIKLGEFHQAQKWMDQLPDEEKKQKLYRKLAQGMAENGQWNEAFQTLQKVEDEFDLRSTIDEIVQYFMQFHGIEKALEFLDELVHTNLVDNMLPIYGKMSDELIKQEKINPLIVVNQRTKSSDAGFFLAEHFLKNKQFEAFEKLNLSASAKVIKLLVKNGYGEQAFKMVKEELEQDFNDRELKEYMTIFSDNHEWEQALLLLSQSVQTERETEAVDKAEEMSSIVTELINRQELDQVGDILSRINTPHLTGKSLVQYLCDLIKNNKEQIAKETYLARGGQGSQLDWDVLDAFTEQAFYTNAYHWIKEGYLVLPPTFNTNNDDRIYCALCVGLFDDGEYEKARNISEKIEDQSYAVPFYLREVQQLFKVGEKKEAVALVQLLEQLVKDDYFDTLTISGLAELSTSLYDYDQNASASYMNKAKQLLKNLRNSGDKAEAYGAIAKQLRLQGRHNQARTTLKKALKHLVRHDDYVMGSPISMICEELCHYEIYVEIQDIPKVLGRNNDPEYGTVSDILIEHGKWEMAEEMITNIEEPRDIISAFCFLATNLFAHDKISEGLRILEQAENQANKIEELFQRNWMYNWIANALLTQNEFQYVIDLLHRMSSGMEFIKVFDSIISKGVPYDQLMVFIENFERKNPTLEAKKEIYDSLMDKVARYYPRSKDVILHIIPYVLNDRTLLRKVVNKYELYCNLMKDELSLMSVPENDVLPII